MRGSPRWAVVDEPLALQRGGERADEAGERGVAAA
jgi:hypothetical protein